MASLARKGAASSGGADLLVRLALAAGAILAVLLAAITIEMFLLLQEMRQMGSSLPNGAPSADRLAAIQSDLDRIQPDIHQVDVHLSQVQGNTANLDPSLRDLAVKIDSLDTELLKLEGYLKDIDQHVASLDRKTGPSPPTALP
jgi:septal ring factor EnvC (AmiA/AmiB activator)